MISKKLLWVFLIAFFLMGPGLIGLSAFLAFDRFFGSVVEKGTIISLYERRGHRQASLCPVLKLESGETVMSAYCSTTGEFKAGERLEVRVGTQVLPNTPSALWGNLLVFLGISSLGSFLFIASVRGYLKRRRLEKAGKVDADGFVTMVDTRH